MIPKIIYGAWFGDELPTQFQRYIDSWSKIMPDYQIKMIGNDNIKLDTTITESLVRKKYCVTSNYIRIKQLYDTGGIYLDTDIEVLKRFDSLLHHSFIIGIEDEWVCNGAVILSEPKHQFLKFCLNELERIDYNDVDVDLATGPRLMTYIAKKYYGWKQGCIGKFKDITIVPPEYFYPYHYTENFKKGLITDNTFAIHHWSQTWGDLVSIVIPCYKQAQYLNEAIESALNQTYKNIEVIVVNDGSPDHTNEVASKYNVKIVVKTNGGLPSARNAGIKEANGKWIVTLDADDKLHRNFILNTIRKADIVSSKLQCFGKSNSTWQSPNKNPTYENLLDRNQLFACAIFKKEVWESVNGYDEEMSIYGKQGCNGYEDWDFWIRAAKKGFKIINVDDTLIYYRKHDNSMYLDALANHSKILNYMRTKYPIRSK